MELLKRNEQFLHKATHAVLTAHDKPLRLGQRVRIVSASRTYNGLLGTITALRQRRPNSTVYVVALERLIDADGGRIVEVIAANDQLKAI